MTTHDPILAAILAEAEAAAATGIDMTQVVKGTSQTLWPKGYVLIRLIEYVEFGSHIQLFKGKPKKDPGDEIALAFEMYGANYADTEGKPGIIRPYSLSLSQNDKSRAHLLFKAMNYKGLAKNFGQLLGQVYLAQIVHDEPAEGEQPRSFLDLKSIAPPIEPMSGQAYPHPAQATAPYKIFLWDRPNLQTWHSLFIEGEYDADPKKGIPAKSKNFVQNKMLSALNFDGSALNTLLVTNNVPFVKPPPPMVAAAAMAAPGMAAPTLAPPLAAPGMVVPAAPGATAVAPPGVMLAPPAIGAPLVAPVAPPAVMAGPTL
jgi:hypothetical protein